MSAKSPERPFRGGQNNDIAFFFWSSFKRVIQLYVQLSENHACILELE